tara:strand:+ start:18715 stop:19512 length:798 start_codon:yes stop_codon:yes gene_type:complete
MNKYRKNIDHGGWFSFNATQEEWKSNYAEKMLDYFFTSSIIERSFGGYTITDELLITNNLNFSGVKERSVLVIGAGPSSSLLTQELLDSYDYVFTCNHFFKNDFLNGTKVNLVLIGDEVSLRSPHFLKYIEKHSPIIGFEHSARRTMLEVLDFKRSYPRSFIYLTRYFSRLGYVARACVLARCMGASKVDFVGMDGFKKRVHLFQKGKKPPSFNDPDKFRKQAKIFYEYMLNDLRITKDNFNNLGENHESSIYTGIMNEVKNETN